MPQNYWTNTAHYQHYNRVNSVKICASLHTLISISFLNKCISNFIACYCIRNAFVLCIWYRYCSYYRISFEKELLFHTAWSRERKNVRNWFLLNHNIHIQFIGPTAAWQNHIVFTIKSIDPWSMCGSISVSYTNFIATAFQFDRNWKLYNRNVL